MSLPVVYRSTDASAPVLTGQAGSLIALLDACLVSGYGTQPAATWTNSVVGTNQKKYVQAGGNGFGCSVNDNGPGAGTFKEARAVGQESGGNFFPTVAQQSAGIIVRKSATADATARVWMLVADDRTFYLFVQTGDSAGFYLAFGFGDFYSYLAGDGFRTMIIGRATAAENSGTVTSDNLDLLGAVTAGQLGHFFARGYTQLGGSVNGCKQGDGSWAAASGLSGQMAYPNPTDGGLYISRVYLTDAVTTPTKSRRGYMRGFYHWIHPIAGVIDGDTFVGVPGSEYDGRSFLIVKTSGNSGVYVIETTNWDTSA